MTNKDVQISAMAPTIEWWTDELLHGFGFIYVRNLRGSLDNVRRGLNFFGSGILIRGPHSQNDKEYLWGRVCSSDLISDHHNNCI